MKKILKIDNYGLNLASSFLINYLAPTNNKNALHIEGK